MDLKKEIHKAGISAILFLIAILIPSSAIWLKIAMYFTAYLVAGHGVVLTAFEDIRNKEPFGECLLMTIATMGAFAAGMYHVLHGAAVFPEEFAEGVAVMLFYQIGELFQSYAVRRSRSSIADLMDIRPDYAVKKQGEDLVKVDPFDVEIGDTIVVRAGEKVPLDGVVTEGSASFDTAALTGESMPKRIAVGGEILSGFINKDGMVAVRVQKEFSESTASKILDLVENASANKAKTERFITKFARIYTPIVVFLALGLFLIPGIFTGEWMKWAMRALNFLIVSCPCALVVSVPLSFFGGIGGASKRGILIKGSNYFELLEHAGVVVFDKTGTLTKGQFKVQKIHAKEIDEASLLYYASMAETHSNHPIALSIRDAFEEMKIRWSERIEDPDGLEIGSKRNHVMGDWKWTPKNAECETVTDIREISGKGVVAMVGDTQVLVGNAGLMAEYQTVAEEARAMGTICHVAIGGKYCGYIVIADQIKGDAKDAIQRIHGLGIHDTVMLTGDRKEIGEKIAKELGIGQVFTELLPADKVRMVEKIGENLAGKKLLFVGDGINDAPALARADVGIAMGGIGSDAAIEAADVVIMQDEPGKIALAIQIAKHTMGIVRQNIWVVLAVKVIILILSALGLANMWMAVFGDVGVTVLAVLNSFRALYTKWQES